MKDLQMYNDSISALISSSVICKAKLLICTFFL